MSLAQPRESSPSALPPRTTAHTLLLKKQSGIPITALTAYDYPTARLVDEAGIDVILVGDSLAMAVLGYDNTLPVTVDEMLHHARAVSRAARSAFLVGDMPYGSYHSSIEQATQNAVRFIKEAGMAAIKIEGGANRAALIEHLTSCGDSRRRPHRPHSSVASPDGRLQSPGKDCLSDEDSPLRRPRPANCRCRRDRP